MVATPYVDELFTIGKKKTINQKNFYILQTKAFIEDVQYRNLRSQLRKIYIKPLIDSGLNVIITHDMNELSFTPIKLQMKFGSIDEMEETIDILKKEICPKPTPVKLEDSSKHEEIRERIENSWDELMRESTLRTMPSDETSFFGVGDAPITTTSTSDYSGGMSPDGTPVDGTLQYLENDRVRQFNGATGTWVELAATNTDSLPSSGTPVTTNEEEVQRILQDLRTTGEPVNRDIDHQFIDRIMGVTTPQAEDDDGPAF